MWRLDRLSGCEEKNPDGRGDGDKRERDTGFQGKSHHKEVDVRCEDGSFGHTTVPSGVSTEEREALELRDGDGTRYAGKEVLRAVRDVRDEITPAVLGLDAADRELVRPDDDRPRRNGDQVAARGEFHPKPSSRGAFRAVVLSRRAFLLRSQPLRKAKSPPETARTGYF